MTRISCRSLIVALAVAFISACGLIGEAKALLAVQNALKAAHGKEFTLSVSNGSAMSVGIVNAGSTVRESAAAAALVEAVARTAYNAYAKRDSLTSLSVGFVETVTAPGVSASRSYPPQSWSGPELRALRNDSP